MSPKKIKTISFVTKTSLLATPRNHSFNDNLNDPVLKTTQLAFLEVNFTRNGQCMSVENLNTDDISGAFAL